MSKAGQLKPCGCCQIESHDLSHTNPPGQSAINYRIGTHSAFKSRMLALLASHQIPEGEYQGQRPLGRLTTRDGQDASIALLDSWAVVADVLTFYQECIANENYLRTAGERRSVLELARAIGYELSPGVSASTYLAFTLDDSEQAPSSVRITAGTQIQSLPDKKGQLPQTFETSKDFVAYPAWNKLQPWQQAPQTNVANRKTIYLAGTNNQLKAGDYLLIDPSGNAKFRRISKVELLTKKDQTRLTMTDGTDAVINGPVCATNGVPDTQNLPFQASNIQAEILAKNWSESNLQAFLEMNVWDAQELLDHIADLSPTASATEVVAFRTRCGVFGNTAPHYNSLPDEPAAPYEDWDPADGWTIWKDCLSSVKDYYQEADLLLDRTYDDLEAGSWVVLSRPASGSAEIEVFKLSDSQEIAKTGFALSARVTGLDLLDPDGNALANSSSDKDTDFTIRNTTVYLQSQALTLASLPVETHLAASSVEIMLSGMVLGLSEGQAIALTGERADAEGVWQSEILEIKQVDHCQGHTTITFNSGLKYSYRRDQVSLNANVIPATHGETISDEILGSGDGSQTFQHFKLKKAPLTHTAATAASGAQSSLTVKVDQVTWHQADSLYGLGKNDRKYVIRIDNQGNAHVIFGDGQQGARLPSGQNNIHVNYRSGTGTAGEVAAGSLSLMKTRPFGTKSVTNPVKASGAADPETLDDARQNAPLKVMTLDRIVSLHDYQAFARAFTGVGKALAEVFWDGEQRVVQVTVADANGDVVESSADLYKNLLAAMQAQRDPRQEVRLGTFQPLFFNLDASLTIGSDYDWEGIKATVTQALLAQFSFSERDFGQSVSAAEIDSTIHGVEGVLAVDIDGLALTTTTDSSSGPASVLPAQLTHRKEPAGPLQPAELLLINPYGITLRSKSL